MRPGVDFSRHKQKIHNRRGKDELASKSSPCRVRHLLLDQGHEVELRVEFIGFRPGIGEKSLLVEFLRYLWTGGFR